MKKQVKIRLDLNTCMVDTFAKSLSVSDRSSQLQDITDETRDRARSFLLEWHEYETDKAEYHIIHQLSTPVLMHI